MVFMGDNSGTYVYSDAIISQLYQGVPQLVEWTDEDMTNLNQAVQFGTLMAFTPKSRKVASSSLLKESF